MPLNLLFSERSCPRE